MNLSQRFPADSEKVKNGVPVKMGDATFILSYFNSSLAQLMFQAESMKLQSTMDAKEAVVTAMNNTLVDVIILGWEGVTETSDEGVESYVEYSKEEAHRILNQYDGLATMIMGEAMKLSNFKKEKKEETLGN